MGEGVKKVRAVGEQTYIPGIDVGKQPNDKSGLGAATVTARPSTKSSVKDRDRTSTLQLVGGDRGGSSRAKEEGTPLRIVLERMRETVSVIKTPRTMTAISLGWKLPIEMEGQRPARTW